jgi:hypothetical protein
MQNPPGVIRYPCCFIDVIRDSGGIGYFFGQIHGCTGYKKPQIACRSRETTMKSLIDTTMYAFLSLSHIWLLLASLMLLIKRKKFRIMPSSVEKRFYQVLITISIITFFWNALWPTPELFGERVGLYWGVKSENAGWQPHTAGFRNQPSIAYSGQTSMAVRFQKSEGWVIFHHFPTAPPLNRYESLEFCISYNNLVHDPLLLSLYSDGKVPNPIGGLLMNDKYRYDDRNKSNGWHCYRVPLSDFSHPGGGIIGVAFGKAAGSDEGTFFLDDVHLITKR